MLSKTRTKMNSSPGQSAHIFGTAVSLCIFAIFSIYLVDFFHRDLFVVSSGSRNYFVIVKFVLEIVKLMKEI